MCAAAHWRHVFQDKVTQSHRGRFFLFPLWQPSASEEIGACSQITSSHFLPCLHFILSVLSVVSRKSKTTLSRRLDVRKCCTVVVCFINIHITNRLNVKKHRWAAAVSCQTDKSKAQRPPMSLKKISGLSEKKNTPKTQLINSTCLSFRFPDRETSLQLYVSVVSRLSPLQRVSVAAQETLSPPPLIAEAAAACTC